jgi:hypothetical protein
MFESGGGPRTKPRVLVATKLNCGLLSKAAVALGNGRRGELGDWHWLALERAKTTDGISRTGQMSTSVFIARSRKV